LELSDGGLELHVLEFERLLFPCFDVLFGLVRTALAGQSS
jgi:hypothetical protein